MGKYIMALDQGTTSSRTILFDKKGNIISKSSKEFLKSALYNHKLYELCEEYDITKEIALVDITDFLGDLLDKKLIYQM